MTTISDTEHWAKPVRKLHVSDVSPEAINLLNMDGRQILSPLQGFGQMWQKTYRVRLPGLRMSAKQVMDIWKNAAFRTGLYRLAAPIRWVGRLFARRSRENGS